MGLQISFHFCLTIRLPSVQKFKDPSVLGTCLLTRNHMTKRRLPSCLLEPAQGPLGLPVVHIPNSHWSAGRRGLERSSDFPSNPELSQVSGPKLGHPACSGPVPPGSGVRGQAAPSLGRLHSPLSGRDQPLTRPLVRAQARQQISCVRRPRRGPGGGASVRGARSCNPPPFSCCC